MFLIIDGQSFVANLLMDFLLWFLRHDKFSMFGVRCENAVKASEVNSWRGHKGCEFFKKFQWGKDHGGGAVGPGSFL